MGKKKGAVSQFEVKEKRRKLSKSGLLLFAVIVIAVAYFAVSGIQIIKLNAERARAQERQEELLRIKEDLTAEYESINSAQYIERLARKNLKLIKSNELLFILPENEMGQAGSDDPDKSDKEDKSDKKDKEDGKTED